MVVPLIEIALAEFVPDEICVVVDPTVVAVAAFAVVEVVAAAAVT